MKLRRSILAATVVFVVKLLLVSALPNSEELRSRHAGVTGPGALSSVPSSRLIQRDWRTNRNLFADTCAWGGGWTLHWNTLDFIFPNVPAPAQKLIELYDSVIDKIAAEWSYEPDQQARTVHLGEVTLDIQSNQAIPLGWLTKFCLDAINQVRATYNAGSTAASYKMIFTRAVSGVVVVVTLTLPWAGAAAAAR
ncbi:MAG: hypothetical protein L6R38_006039 [Xanthoria sp. 2 TBL-2021]|nr:MAG: hypothetical protein L6R38_006039 [Xanthoria sp. 2 TBL-2021]